MHSHGQRALLLLATLSCFAAPGEAQTGGAAQVLPPLPAGDSIYRRARRLVSDGNGALGRAVVDSMVRASTEGSPAYGDAIFWRGALAQTAAEAERDYRRVIVEYPLSPYADDALLSLAELEQARGDRTAAYQHLQRFVREHPVGAARARAGLAAARLAFEQRDMTRGCAMIVDARASAGTSDVELRNQIEYYGGRCATVADAPEPAATVAAAPTPSTAPRTTSAAPGPVPAAVGRPALPAPPKRTTSSRTPARSEQATSAPLRPEVARSAPPKPDSVPAPRTPAAPRGTWTIQLAAFNTRPDAERLVVKLASRGVKARISGEGHAPFRVRLDYYATRQDAAAAVAELKERGIIGFVTEEARASGVSSP
ncbi:MAG: SPOR domain-containing protein [bacterium]